MISRARKAFRLQLLPLVAGFVVLAAIVGTRSLLIESQRADNIAVREAFELERRIVQTLSLVQDAETGQRGYMLTGEAQYLAPYRSAAEALPGELDKLKIAMADDPQRTAAFGELKSAIGDKLKELAETIAILPVRRARRCAGDGARRPRQGLYGPRPRGGLKHQAK